MKIKLDRSMTLNVGNFSNIKPNVSIEFDVDKDLDKKYMLASTILEVLFKLETSVLSCEYNDVIEKGRSKYTDEGIENFEERLKSVKENFNKLKGIN